MSFAAVQTVPEARFESIHKTIRRFSYPAYTKMIVFIIAEFRGRGAKVQDALVLAAAGIVVGCPNRPVELVELIDGHGVGAAVTHPAVGLDSAAIIIGEGIQVGPQAAAVAESGWLNWPRRRNHYQRSQLQLARDNGLKPER